MGAIRIADFDHWQPGYGFATLSVFIAGTSTLASVFTDEALTQAAANPQTLASLVAGGINYGKLSAPLYVGTAFYYTTSSNDTSGIIRPPLTSLTGADASETTVVPAGGIITSNLDDLFARHIDVRDYGLFVAVGAPGASSSTNNATLVAAIGVAAALSGAYVDLPQGTYAVTQFTVPQAVVLRGFGRGVTILQSTAAGNVATLSGPRAGLTKLSLDGVTLVAGSIGIYAANVDQIVLDDTEIKRFETGMWRKGGSICNWKDLYVSNCVSGYKAHGDSALGFGGALLFNTWTGGKIELCTGIGIELRNVDSVCEHNVLEDVAFDTNTGVAVNIVGARYFSFEGCHWFGNTTDIAISDGSPLTAANTVIGGEFTDGETDSGTINLTGAYQQIAFRRMTMVGETININAPGQNIVVEDCHVSNPTITGVPTCWLYRQTANDGTSFGTSTGTVSANLWSLALKSGQQVYLETKVIGRQRNGINTIFFHAAVSAGRPGATLNYQTQTGNFTLGDIVTGGTSGATGRITAATNSGATGSLTLQDIIGTFVNNENLTDGAGGVAVANGGITESAAALAGSFTQLRTVQRTDATYGCGIVASGPNILVQGSGDTGHVVEWSCDVEVLTDQSSPLILAQASVTTASLSYHNLVTVGDPFLLRSGLAFQPGRSITDLTSGATGIVVGETNTGSTGTITLINVVGAFQSTSTIFDSISNSTAIVT